MDGSRSGLLPRICAQTETACSSPDGAEGSDKKVQTNNAAEFRVSPSGRVRLTGKLRQNYELAQIS